MTLLRSTRTRCHAGLAEKSSASCLRHTSIYLSFCRWQQHHLMCVPRPLLRKMVCAPHLENTCVFELTACAPRR